MGKGELTKQSILKHAASLATEVGLDGLTIGRLADDLGLSKSGLFAHFQSKELLQLAAMEFAAQRFIDTAVKPSLSLSKTTSPPTPPLPQQTQTQTQSPSHL